MAHGVQRRTEEAKSNSNLRIRKLKRHGCINKYVCISVVHWLTLSGRFRVVFGVGHVRTLTFRDRPQIFEF